MSEITKTSTVRVVTNRGNIPFSIGYLASTLLVIGIPQDRAYRDAYSISLIVNETQQSEFTSDEIMQLTVDWYRENDERLANRVDIIRQDLEPIKPLIILFGGVTGIGKSTIAQLFAKRMGIKSIMGTDLIREVLRVTISSPDLMPTLHTSSYIAYSKLDTTFLPALSKPIVGFEEQARSVIVGVEAAIEQALKDNEMLIIEGVHLIPGLIRRKMMKNRGTIAFQLVLEDEESHHSRLHRRESKLKHRGTNYSKFFEEIREIQSYLIEQAKNNHIPIIEVDNDEKALLKIINTVWDNRLINI
jgi:2-phosphoglycerate kinase